MLTNTDLIHILYEKLGKKHSQKDIEKIIETLFTEITNQIKNGEEERTSEELLKLFSYS